MKKRSPFFRYGTYAACLLGAVSATASRPGSTGVQAVRLSTSSVTSSLALRTGDKKSNPNGRSVMTDHMNGALVTT